MFLKHMRHTVGTVLVVVCTADAQTPVSPDQAPDESQVILQQLMSAWRSQMYWRGKPDTYRAGARVVGLQFWDAYVAGLCSGQLGLCALFGRDDDDSTVRSLGRMKRASASSDSEMVREVLKQEGWPVVVFTEATEPQAARPSKAILPALPPPISARSEPRRLRSRSVTLVLPEVTPPDEAVIPKDWKVRENLIQSLLRAFPGAEPKCGPREIIVPHFSQHADEVFILISDSRCGEEVVKLLFWHTGEWRVADRWRQGKEEAYYAALIRAARWQIIQQPRPQP